MSLSKDEIDTILATAALVVAILTTISRHRG